MLLTFTFRNYGPYKDESTFDMRAIRAYHEHPYSIVELPNQDDALKVAMIYGANGSGKTQFVEAYDRFFSLVESSFSDSASAGFTQGGNRDLVRGPGVLERSHNSYALRADEDIEFDAELVMAEGLYRYGFSYNSTEITAEWLSFYKRETNRETMLIERDGQRITLGNSVRGECEKYVKNVPPRSLVLSFLKSLDLRTDSFAKAYSAAVSVVPLSMRLSTIGALEYVAYSYFKNSTRKDEEERELRKRRLLDFLAGVDISIEDFIVEERGDRLDVRAVHSGRDGERYELPLRLESAGTLKMIGLFSFIFAACNAPYSGVVIDELDSELHPLILRYIVNMFYNDGVSSQLVFTAHDLSLLDKRYVRRDQVWFSEKDRFGCSSLKSLAEYKVRNDSAFRDSYLGGVFGGIPNLVDDDSRDIREAS